MRCILGEVVAGVHYTVCESGVLLTERVRGGLRASRVGAWELGNRESLASVVRGASLGGLLHGGAALFRCLDVFGKVC
jgi:hypothetical protein